jgi:hyperosmotically inducible periplasmic protein
MSRFQPTPSQDRSADGAAMRSAQFKSRSRRWPGLLAAGILGAGLAAAYISSVYDDRSVGTRLDAAVESTRSGVQEQVAGLQSAASGAAVSTARAADGVAVALSDAGITAAVKASLAADPALSALQIDVSTEGGVVRLDGPAPTEKARERAQVLALAPNGVVRVDNRLVVAPKPEAANDRPAQQLGAYATETRVAPQ